MVVDLQVNFVMYQHQSLYLEPVVSFVSDPVHLQGVKEKGVFLLTDPAIHSAIGDFGRDNKRAMGMAKFFDTHVCNSICEELKLTKQK